MLTDSEAPTYNFNSDDEAPCEFINEIYAISEDTFCFKIIKRLGQGYNIPGNGHKIKILYYELGKEEHICLVDTYLGKNDVLPYICEIAIKCMKENEVSLIQGPKVFSKIFRNSEVKQKYEKKEKFQVEFKKSLRFKQKGLKKYQTFPEVKELLKLNITTNDVNILWKKKQLENEKNKINKHEKNTQNNKNHTNKFMSNDFVSTEEYSNLKYKFLDYEDLCTYVVYLKEFHRVDILNEKQTIVKEILEEGSGIFTPKKNDYVEFFLIETNCKKEYIHCVLDIQYLKYKGLFPVLQNMKKGEKAKIILKDNETEHVRNCIKDEINGVGNEQKTKEMILELIDFKKSKITKVISLSEGSKQNTVLFYATTKTTPCKNNNNNNNSMYRGNMNKPIVDNECEMIIRIILKYSKRKNGSKLVLPIQTDNAEMFKINRGYFLYSYGTCFSSPVWFYECFKNLTEGEEITIPQVKNEHLFSENQLLYQTLMEGQNMNIQETNQEEEPTNIEKTKEDEFLQNLIEERNKGRGLFLINKLKKKHVNQFCKEFCRLQKDFADKKMIRENLKKLVSFYKKLKNRKKKRKYNKRIIQRTCKKNRMWENKKKNQEKKRFNEEFFMNHLKKVHFTNAWKCKDAILKIQITKIICKKKDPWNMLFNEKIENIKIYNEKGNAFMKKNFLHMSLLHYKKAFDICRFSEIYKLIFEEKKMNHNKLAEEKNKELLLLMEKILTNLSICSFKMSNYDKCIQYTDRVITLNPNNVKAIYWKNKSYLQQNKYTIVIENLNNPNYLKDPYLLKLYSEARMLKKKHDDNFKSLFFAMYDKH